jgi:hypothetical protein
MLSVNKYPKRYVDECRSRMESQLAAYKALVTTAREKAGTSKSAFNSAVDSFAPLFFSNLVVVLDGFFVHRTRTLEKKDGNPLNEVRMICNSILQSNGVMSADKTIKYSPEKSILKLQIGDEIKLTESDFVLLFKAFFADIESKFV